MEMLQFSKKRRRNKLLIIIILSLFYLPIHRMQAQNVISTYTTAGTHGYNLPANVTKLKVEVWGAGGNGGSVSLNAHVDWGAGGGGGGGYSKSILTGIPAGWRTVTVGAGGKYIGDPAVNGGDSWFHTSTTILAKGGGGVATGSFIPGAGAAAGIGNVVTYTGGSGVSGSDQGLYRAGGGGSSAGSGNNGVNAGFPLPYNKGIAPWEGGDGGDGAMTAGINGSDASSPGGGGGGAWRASSGFAKGGDGGDGKVRITHSNFYLQSTQASSPLYNQGETSTVTLQADLAGLPYGVVNITYTLTDHTPGIFSTTGTITFTTTVKEIVFETVPLDNSTTLTITKIETDEVGNTIDANHTAQITLLLPPQGSLEGNSICDGETGQLTFTATEGSDPFTLIINDVTYTDILNGVPFNAEPNPTITTNYTLTSITDGNNLTRTTDITDPDATITMNTDLIYRSKANGNWTDKNIWEFWDGSGWVNANDYPGETPGECINLATVFNEVTAASPITFDNVIVENEGILTVTPTLTFHDMDVLSGGTLILPGEAVIEGSGSFYLRSGAKIHVGSANGVSMNDPSGNIRHTVRTYESGAHFRYSGISNQITGDGFTQNQPGSFEIDNPGNMVSLSGVSAVTGDLIISNGTLSSGNHHLSLGGNWYNSDTFVPGTATVTFNGSTQQNIGGTSETTFHDLILNNPGGFLLEQNLTVGHQLALENGVVTTGDQVLTMLASGAITASSPTAHIDGKLARGFDAPGAKLFPVGKDGNYRPLSFEYKALDAASIVLAEQFETGLTGTLPTNTHLLTTNRHWMISQTGAGNFQYFVTLDPAGCDPGTNAVVILKKHDEKITAHPTSPPAYTNADVFSLLSEFGLGTVSPTVVVADDKSVHFGTASVTLTATLSPIPDGGTIEFFINDQAAGSVGVVTATGTATLNFNPAGTQPGNYVIKAEYSGHGIYTQGSSDPLNNGTLEIIPPLLRAHVTQDGGGAKNGTNWANAFDHSQLQFAIDVPSVVEVWVAAGTYTPTSYNGIDPGEPEDVRHKHFYISPGLRLYGGFAGNEPADYDLSLRDFAANETILSGDIGATSNCYHVVVIGDAEATSTITPTVTIDGFTIKDGQTHDKWYNSGGEDPVLADFISFGGGMLVLNCNPEISNCKFINNEGYLGGGIGSFMSSPTISNCSFEENVAYGSGAGLALYISFSELTGARATVTNCSFLNNISIRNFWDDEDPFFAGGGAIYMLLSEGVISNSNFSGNEALYGGAMCNMFAIPEIEHCVFENNTGVIGGAIANLTVSLGKGTKQSQIVEYLRKHNSSKDDPDMSTKVRNSIFKNNEARWKEGALPEKLGEQVAGGAFANINANGVLINCLFYDNQAGSGGAAANYGGELELTNCTMFGNSSLIGGAFYQDDGIGAIHNTILWDNWVEEYPEPPYQDKFIGHQVAVVSGTFTLDYSCFPDSEDDIYFENGVALDLDENIHLNPQFKDVAGDDYRITRSSPCIDAGLDSYNSLLTDIRGEGYNRKLDITGMPGVIDIGAYEFNAPFDNEPKHYYVNDDAVGANNGTNWPDAFNSLQSALEIAIYNDVIWVAAGTYTPTHFMFDPDPLDTRMKTFFVAPGVRLYGGFAGNEPEDYDLETRNFQLNESILSGNIGTASNCYHVIISAQDPETIPFTEPTVIDGFTITNGQADKEVSGGQLEDLLYGTMGGGMLLLGGKQSIKNCIFKENVAGIGGGLSKFAGEISIDNCRFDNNTVLLAGAGLSLIGAGATEGEEAGLVLNCSFENNQVLFSEPSAFDEEMIPGGGAVLSLISMVKFGNSTFNSNKALFGGAVCSMMSLHEIDNCNFTDNLALMGGAIISFFNLSLLEITEGGKAYTPEFLYKVLPNKEPQIITKFMRGLNLENHNVKVQNQKDIDKELLAISNSIFSNNAAEWDLEPGMEEAMVGGAIGVFGSAFDAVNCLFTQNTAFTGGAIANIFGLANLANITLTENSAMMGGAYAQINSESNFVNTIFWDNQVAPFPDIKNGDVYLGHQIATASGTLTIDYSCYPDRPDDIFTDENSTINFGQNNIHQYPHFVNVWEKDFRIAGSSPCVDVGISEANDEEFDIRGEGFPRKMPKTAGKDNPVIDMGAYEYNHNTDPPYPCNNPQYAGEIVATATLVCSGDFSLINSISEAGIYSGTLEYKWQASTSSADDGFSDIEESNNASYEAVDLTTTTWFKRMARVNCMSDWSGAVETNVVEIIVLPASVGGVVSPSQTICYGNTPGDLVLHDHQGEVLRWQKSNNEFFSPAEDIGTFTGTVLSSDMIGTLTQTTWFLVEVQNSICSPVFSTTSEITVSSTTLGGTVTPSQIICYDSEPGDMMITGHIGEILKWQKSLDEDFDISIDIAESGEILSGNTLGTLTQTTYFRAVVQSGVCPPMYSETATINIEAIPLSGTLIKWPDTEYVLIGSTVSASFTSGNGGNEIDELEYSADGGNTWLNYTSGSDITANSPLKIVVRTRRMAAACNPSDYYSVEWIVYGELRVHNVTQNLFYPEIQMAINNSNSGDVLKISNGVYDEVVSTAEKNGIVLTPGFSAGEVTINGKLTLTAKDELQMELFGDDDYDKFIILDEASINGATLDIKVVGTYKPEAGTKFIIFNSPNDPGKFSNPSLIKTNGHYFILSYEEEEDGKWNVVLSTVAKMFKMEIRQVGDL